jgi:hypothetical protein
MGICGDARVLYGAAPVRLAGAVARQVLFALLIALSLCATTAHAEQPTLSGRWSATAMRIQWNIGDWGKACGPKPGGGGAPGGTVTIQQVGSELTITGAGPTYSTTHCWEQFPGLLRRSHSGGQRGWHNVCKTAANDPRQATVITTISATDNAISFDETGQYQFVIEGQNCTASVRRTRSFRLIQRQGEPPPQPAASAPPPEPKAPAAPEKPKPPPKRCSETGPPARLEVRPSRKLMRPGEQFTFRARVLDAKGCALSLAPTWKIDKKDAPAKLTGAGRVHVADDAPETEIPLSALVAGRAAHVTVEVASSKRYDALLRSGAFDESGESGDAAVAVIASGSIGSRSVVARDAARAQKRRFIAILGGAALLLGIVGLLLVRRSRRQHAAANATDSDASASAQSAAGAPASRRRGTICPTCREEYPADAGFCAMDGNRLIPVEEGVDPRGPTGGVCPVCGQGFDPGVQTCPTHDEELVPAAVYMADREQGPLPTKAICPVCGTQYPGDSQFCGADGAALVPVN